jgi:WD40 repeat protein
MKDDGKTEFIEYLVLFNLKENVEIARITLDLDDNLKNPEDASKLYVLSKDSQTLIARSDNKKGLKIISLEDGSMMQETKQIHKKPITKISLLADQKTVVTSSKDRSVCAYDFISHSILGEGKEHRKPVLCHTITSDDKYVFSGSKDKQICCYYFQNWQPLCSLPFPFPTHDI